MEGHDDTRVIAVRACALTAGGESWPFATRHAAEIDAHWQRRSADNPNFFNGTIYVLADHSFTPAGELVGRFMRTDFKSFLYWREAGFPEAGVWDAFGSGVIRSADGLVLLGRQREGHLNGGRCYPPGGLIDDRDIGADGTIDIERSVAREVAEETGLVPAALTRTGRYLATLAGPLLSIAVIWQSDLPASALAEQARRHIASDPESELADVLFVAPGGDHAGLDIPHFARALLAALGDLKSET